jgi:predicted DsbA family dithiol-disulfide isomerase
MGFMAQLQITEYTDPACPFAWSAEPSRRRLAWLYGDQLEWHPRMVGLAESGEEYAEKGFTPERQADSYRRLSEVHHMPIDTSERPRLSGTIPACRAVVATRLHRPDREQTVLRALRVLNFSGHPLDEPATHALAARAAEIDPEELARWVAEPATEKALEEDLACSRHPTPRALAMDHKLAGWSDGRRYTCPSYEIARIADGVRISVPGFQPLAAYEVVIANLLPDADRRSDPHDVREVLSWWDEPMATIEVATVCDIDLPSARQALGRVAHEEHLGFDGLWSLAD